MTEPAIGTGPSDVEREQREADEAQAEAEAAVRRAEIARADADAARLRAQQEAESRRRRWAQSVVDGYDADLAAAEEEVRTGADRFVEAAATDLTAAVAAYLAWTEASLRHYALQVRVAAVAPVLEMDATPAARIAPPPFSAALDAALDRRVGELSARIRDAEAEAIRVGLDADPGVAPAG